MTTGYPPSTNETERKNSNWFWSHRCRVLSRPLRAGPSILFGLGGEIERGQDTNNWQGNEQVKPITQSLAPTRACGGQLEMFTRKLRAEISFVFLGLIPPASRRTLSKPMEQPLCSTFDQLVLLPTRTRISNDLFGEISKLSYNY